MTAPRPDALLIPRRRRGVELLDDPAADGALAARSLRDIALANRWFGGTAAVLAALGEVWDTGRPSQQTMLDVGTGAGDIPARARDRAAARGIRLTTFGVERTHEVARGAASAAGPTCVADGLALPFADQSVDVVTCSQVLHHFEDERATWLLREMHRVAARAVIVADLRRSWTAAAGIWTASFALGFHPVSRHDGVLSVFRGYRGAELAQLVERATGVAPTVRDRPGFRLTASWPTTQPAARLPAPSTTESATTQ